MSSVILSPALIAPRTKIVNKLVPMCIENPTSLEYILSQFPIVVGAIKETTLIFYKYHKSVVTNSTLIQTLLTTLGEIPIKYTINVKPESADEYEVDKLLDEFHARKIATLDVRNRRELIKEIVNFLVTKYRTYEIRPAPHYLLYVPSRKILTRLCWVDDVSGKVDLYSAKTLTILVADKVHINEKFIDKIELSYLEDFEPITVPDLIDKVAEMDKLLDIWNREISRIKRSEAKKRALSLLEEEETEEESTKGRRSEEAEEAESETSEESSKEGEEEINEEVEERVET